MLNLDKLPLGSQLANENLRQMIKIISLGAQHCAASVDPRDGSVANSIKKLFQSIIHQTEATS